MRSKVSPIKSNKKGHRRVSVVNTTKYAPMYRCMMCGHQDIDYNRVVELDDKDLANYTLRVVNNKNEHGDEAIPFYREHICPHENQFGVAQLAGFVKCDE